MQFIRVESSVGADRFYIDGKRVTRARYWAAVDVATRAGTLNSLRSKLSPPDANGDRKRRHYACG